LFEDVDWSTERVFRQTLDRAAEIGLETVILPSWYDVDDADTLRMLLAELIDDCPFRREGSTPPSARWTRLQIRELLNKANLAQRLNGEPAVLKSA
jgi:hypothetical protein